MWYVFERARDRATALLPEASLLAIILKCSLLLVFCLLISFILPQACSTDSGCWLPSVKSLKSFDFISLQKSSDERRAVLITSVADRVRRATTKTTTTITNFAAFADAVAAVDDLVRVPTAATAPETTVAELVRQQLSYAIQDLFPFLSVQHIQGFTNSHHRRRESKGLVIPCGNTGFEAAVHLIVAVRNVFGSSIPIEVMFAGSNDLDIEKQNAMKSLHKNVSVVDILHVFDESIVGLQGGGWAIKPFAIMASSFEQVIMADADCVFLQSPEAAFDDPGYIASGTLFFHDRVFDFPNATPGNSDRFQWWNSVMNGRTPSPMLQQSKFWSNVTIDEMESGVVLINKSKKRALLGLMFTAWMNTKVVRETVTYVHSYDFHVNLNEMSQRHAWLSQHDGTSCVYVAGDKESFWMAFELAGIPYFFSGDYASAIGNATKDPDTSRPMLCCSNHKLHLDSKKKPFWHNGSLYQDKCAAKDKKQWLCPQHWAMDMGHSWQWDCMVDIEADGGIQNMSVGGYGDVYQAMVREAIKVNSAFHALV